MKFQRGNKRLLWELGWGHLCDILAKTLAALCVCPENPSEAEFKSNQLIISLFRRSLETGWHSGRVSSSLLNALTRVCRDREQQVEQKGVENVQTVKERKRVQSYRPNTAVLSKSKAD